MPKVVDHDERRRIIARAACRVARRDGVAAVSVRSVAEEAGVSPGSLRHYFVRQDDLLRAAMEQVMEQVRARIAGTAFPADPAAAVTMLVEQVLPLDQTRREEMEIWLAFTAHAAHDDALAAVSRASHESLHQLSVSALATLAEAGMLRAGVDRRFEADRLHALIDGLATHAYLHPDLVTPAHIRGTMDYHLQTLVTGRP